MAVKNIYAMYREDVVSLLLKEGASANIIDNVSSIIHVHVVIHVYLFHILS